MKKWIKEKGFLEILNALKNRKFKGYTGLAIKNSFFQTTKSIISKLGGLLTTIILARFLLPELFGLYSLAISTIFIFISFTGIGIGSALIKFVSNELLNKKKQKAKAYMQYLLKIKIMVSLTSAFILILLSKIIATNYYQKPIFLALIIGSPYVLSLSLINFMEYLFSSVNQFKELIWKELFLQISRILLIIGVLIIILNNSLSKEFTVFLIVACFSISCLLSLFFLIIRSKKKIYFLRYSTEKLKKLEQGNLKKFLIPLTILSFSGLFFGYIDMIMLGRFINPEYIGYYAASFSLTGVPAAILGFSTALLPIFSRLKGARLKRGLKKSINIIFPISFLFSILTIIFSPLIIKIIYGTNYIPSINLLRILALLIMISPTIPIYINYFISKGKTNLIAKLAILVTVLNIILNYVLISVLVQQSDFLATMGASIATIFSVYVHLGLLIYFSKK
jgi:stage V sporulation protein B